jgi:hypothetical protein
MTGHNRSSFLLALAIVSLVVSWLVFSQLAVPPLIKSAYRGESLPIFNSLIAGQALHPIEHYLATWHRIAWRTLFILLPMAGLIFLILNNSAPQTIVDARLETLEKNARASDPLTTLRRYRIWIAYAVIVVIAGGSLFAIVTDTEHWPFSPYAMYSWIDRDYSLTRSRLFGVTESEPPHEIPLWEFQYIQPFDNARLHTALARIHRSPTPKQRFSGALHDVLVRYEALRHAGRHHGPPLQGIRLYELYWKLDPWARNADQPDRQELILEVMDPVKK